MSASQPLSPMTPSLTPELPLPEGAHLVIEDATPVDHGLSAKRQHLLVEVLLITNETQSQASQMAAQLRQLGIDLDAL